MEGINIYVLDMSKQFNDADLSRKAKGYVEKESVHYLIDKYSGPGKVMVGEYGKPYKENGIKFNISHSNNLCIIGVSSIEIGVDIEFVRNRNLDIMNRFFAKEEKDNVSSLKDFYKVWTNKESLVKCIGVGLRTKVSSIPGFPFEGARVYNSETYYAQTIEYDNYIISVTTRGKDKEKINIVRENWIKWVKN